MVDTKASTVREVNAYSHAKFAGRFSCSHTRTKGRILRSTQDFRQGEIISIESPLLTVCVDEQCPDFLKLEEFCESHPDEFSFDPLYYWCALMSLTRRQLHDSYLHGKEGITEEMQRKLLLLHREKYSLECRPGQGASMLSRRFAPDVASALIDALVQAWILNSFERAQTPQAVSIHFLASFMSHSCAPNVFWYYSMDQLILRARSDIAVGDELCISYVSEDYLLRSASERRCNLFETKHFWCGCKRCDGEVDLSRGFVCPYCRSGIVFARMIDAEGAEPETALAIQGARCNFCGHSLDSVDAEGLESDEAALSSSINRFRRSVFLASSALLVEAHALEESIDAVFAQHWLADLAWTELIRFYAQWHLYEDQVRLLRRRCDFICSTYDGLTATHALAMEAQGDALTAAFKRGWRDCDCLEADKSYKIAATTISRLYGTDHKFYFRLRQKRCMLIKFRRAIRPRNCGVRALSASWRRRRVLQRARHVKRTGLLRISS